MIFLRARNRQFFSNLPTLALVCIGAGLAPGVFGCTVGIEEERVTQVPTVSEVQPQAPAQEKSPQPLAPIKETTIKEATLEEQPFKLQELSVREEHGQTTIRFRFSNPASQYRHFSLTQPSRIVLDIFGETKRLARVESFRVDTNWVGALRLSSSEGYLRMVMEIAAATVPPYVIEPESGGLKVIIGPLDPKATAKKELQLIQGGKRTDINIKVAETKPAVSETAPTAPVAPETAPTAPIPETPPTAEKKYTGQRISLDFKDADIKNVFRLLAEVSGLNIIVTDDVVKKVTVRLVDVPWDQALALLIDTNGLGKEQMGNVVRISSAAQLKEEKEALKAAKDAEDNLEPLQTAYLSINYAKVKDLVEKIKPSLTPRGVIVADERSSTIIVRDIKLGIDEATTIVSRLDTRTPQVLIESNLIETTPTFARSLGFELDVVGLANRDPSRFTAFSSRSPAGSPFSGAAQPEVPPVPIPFAGLRFGTFLERAGVLRNLSAFLTAAETEGNIRIISRPSVVTLNNVPSTISSLRILRITLPASTNVASGSGSAAGATIATEKITVGILLSVTPQISSDGFILMNISVKSSSIADNPTVSDGTGGVVPFDELTREAISNVLVRDGETIVIGGIMKDSRQNSQSGVPYLKDIPVLGWLFQNIRWQKDFEELVVFITPRIIAGGSENLPSAEQLWRDRMKKTEGG